MSGPFPKPIYTINGLSSSSSTGNMAFLGAGGITVSGSGSVITISDSGGGGSVPSPTLDGQIPIGSSGGTFTTTTLTAGAGISIANGPGSITISATGGGGGNVPSPTLDGQIPIGSSGGTFTTTTLTAGAGISIANGPGSVTISATGLSLTWMVISANQTLVPNHGYFIQGNLILALPATSKVGDVISVVLPAGGSWFISQSGTQQIKIGNLITTAGVAGSLSSNASGDCVSLVCFVANSHWISFATHGNIMVI